MDDRPDEQVAPFDERAALAELERFRLEIERYKARRRAVGDEFDGFIRSFNTPLEARGTQPAIPAIPATNDRQRFTPIVESTAPLPPVAPPQPVQPARRQTRTRTRAAIGGALVVLAGALLATWTWTRRAPASSTPLASDAAAPAALPATREPPAVAHVTASSAATELATSRAVWVRVLADGARVVERELPANARVPLKAEKTIVIRTGDAGAVRLRIGGRDQGALGRDGEVVTRTFSLPPQEKR